MEEKDEALEYLAWDGVGRVSGSTKQMGTSFVVSGASEGPAQNISNPR